MLDRVARIVPGSINRLSHTIYCCILADLLKTGARPGAGVPGVAGASNSALDCTVHSGPPAKGPWRPALRPRPTGVLGVPGEAVSGVVSPLGSWLAS
eukprot:1185167-Prorocentrum_minimum.AAC.2